MEVHQEHMVRWKRTAKTRWYYLPMVFHSLEEAAQRAEQANKTSQFYRIEVVAITAEKVWSSKDEVAADIQGQAMEPTVPEIG